MKRIDLVIASTVTVLVSLMARAGDSLQYRALGFSADGKKLLSLRLEFQMEVDFRLLK
jgi:hypothetical protein